MTNHPVLSMRQRVGRATLLIQATLVADTDRASVVRSGMSTHLQQFSELRQAAILSAVEVIPHGAETTSLVVEGVS